VTAASPPQILKEGLAFFLGLITVGLVLGVLPELNRPEAFVLLQGIFGGGKTLWIGGLETADCLARTSTTTTVVLS
jgi:hypothetical protein